VYTSVTDSDGYASFSIDLTLDTVNVYKCKLVYEGNATMGACWYDFMFWHGNATELDLTSDMMFISGSDETHFLATLTGLDNQGNKLGVPGQVISFYELYTPELSVSASQEIISSGEETSLTAQLIDTTDGSRVGLDNQTVNFYELYTLGVLLSKPSDVLKGDTVPLSARLIDSVDYSRLFFEDEEIGFYERFIRDKVSLTGSNQFIKANEESVLSAKVLDVDGSYISDVPVFFEEEVDGDYSIANVTGSHVIFGETTPLSATVTGTGSVDGLFIRFYVDEPDGVDDEVIIPVVEEPEPVVTSVGLVGSKSVLSAYDSDTCILTATVLDEEDNPMEGESVVFKQDGTTLATKQTNSNGVASYTYSAAGSGDVSFTASVGSIVSETYSVEDCIFYHSDAISYTGTSTSDTVYSLGYDEIADLSNTDFEFSWKFHQTQRGADVCLGASSEFSVSPVKSNYRVYLGGNDSGVGRYGYRTTSSSTSTSGTVSANTVYDMKITRNSDTFNYYLNDNLLGTKTASFFSNYNMFGIHTVQWNTGTTTISNLKIKPL